MKYMILLLFVTSVSCSFFQKESKRSTASSVDCNKALNKKMKACRKKWNADYTGTVR